MSPFAKWSIVLAAGFFAIAFALAGVYAGHLSPRGPAPMYVLAAICAVGAFFALRAKPIKDIPGVVTSSNPNAMPGVVNSANAGASNVSDHNVDVAAMDLTKLSAAGCGLILSTVIIAFILMTIAAVGLPELFEDRREIRVVGIVVFFGLGVYFTLADGC